MLIEFVYQFTQKELCRVGHVGLAELQDLRKFVCQSDRIWLQRIRLPLWQAIRITRIV